MPAGSRNKRGNFEGTFIYELCWEFLDIIFLLKLSEYMQKLPPVNYYNNIILQYLDFILHLICNKYLIRKIKVSCDYFESPENLPDIFSFI